jgi:capsular exopolysaccharide synthesis family protein
MSKLLSALRKMQDTGKWTPTLAPEVSEPALDEPDRIELHSQATELVSAELALSDSGYQEVPRAQMRREKRHPENPKAFDRNRPINERLVASYQFDPVAAEQYRKLYIEIAQAKRTSEIQTLLITSALAGEGKSISALNLAITSAAHADQHSVLLIDADLRKPALHNYLGIRPECGLTDYLLGDVEYSRIFCKTRIPGLIVITAGGRTSDPAALLASTRMEQFVRNTRSQKQYNYIILDTSPVLLTSEPKSLLQYVDTAILVVRAKKTPAAVVSQVIKILGEENILGCVFNGVTSSDLPFYHYSYSADYYHTNPSSSQLT